MASGTIDTSDSSFGNIVNLKEYIGATEQTLSLYDNANKYALLIYRLRDTNGDVIATATIPPRMARNLTVYLYGSSSSQWGRVTLNADYDKATFNRTSSNTSEIVIYGVGRI